MQHATYCFGYDYHITSSSRISIDNHVFHMSVNSSSHTSAASHSAASFIFLSGLGWQGRVIFVRSDGKLSLGGSNAGIWSRKTSYTLEDGATLVFRYTRYITALHVGTGQR